MAQLRDDRALRDAALQRHAVASIDESAARVSANKEKFMGAATGAIMKAISSDAKAAEAFAKMTQANPFSVAPAQRAAADSGSEKSAK